MTFKQDWNSEILCQFWATLYIDEEHKVFHYRCDYRQFSRLLGFNRDDRTTPSLYDLYPNGVGILLRQLSILIQPKQMARQMV